MNAVSFFRKPITLILAIVYFLSAAAEFYLSFTDNTQITNTSDNLLEENLFVSIIKYSFSCWFIICAVVYLLLYIFSKNGGKGFSAATILLKVEASLEIAFDVFLAISFILILLAVLFTSVIMSFIFLPTIVFSGIIVTVVSIALGTLIITDIVRNISKLLFAGAASKNTKDGKLRTKSAAFYAIMNFISAGLGFITVLLLLVFAYEHSGVFLAVFTTVLVLPFIINGILAVKYTSIPKEEAVAKCHSEE